MAAGATVAAPAGEDEVDDDSQLPTNPLAPVAAAEDEAEDETEAKEVPPPFRFNADLRSLVAAPTDPLLK